MFVEKEERGSSIGSEGTGVFIIDSETESFCVLYESVVLWDGSFCELLLHPVKKKDKAIRESNKNFKINPSKIKI